MAIDTEASRLRRRIRDVLNAKWDPIGGDCPEDEYDEYAQTLAAMIRAGASDDPLVAYLDWAETLNMACPGSPERRRKVVAALRALGP